MTPIEAMAKAYHESYPEQYRDRWDDVCEAERSDYCSGMRAALLALADCEIPENVSQAGADAVNEPVMQIYEEEAEKCFRAMLRAIAVQEVAEGSFVDTSTPTGKLAEMVMEMAVHLGQAGKIIHDLQAAVSQRSDEEARSADTATAEHSSVSLTQKGTEA